MEWLVGLAILVAVLLVVGFWKQRSEPAGQKGATRPATTEVAAPPADSAPTIDGPISLMPGGHYEHTEGDGISGRGLYVRDAEGFAVRWNDLTLKDAGFVVVKVAGAQRQADLLNSDAAAPGAHLTLEADPENEFDSHAVRVLAEGRQHLGFVERGFAEQVSGLLQEGFDLGAVVLWEWRKEGEGRVGIRALVGPADDMPVAPLPGLRQRGSWYELPTGEKVQGFEKAQDRLRTLVDAGDVTLDELRAIEAEQA
jgi:hypothetical protein